MTRDRLENSDRAPAFKPDYSILCYVGLFVILLALMGRNFGASSIIPIVVGVIALVFQWQSGPVLMLLSLVWLFVADTLGMTPMAFASGIVGAIFGPMFGLQLAPQYRSFPRARPRDAMPFVDLILCLGVIAYCAGHYRLQSLVRQILPIDSRRKVPSSEDGKGVWFWKSRAKPLLEMRPKGLVSGSELVALITAIPVCAALAELGWILISLSKGNRALDLPASLWRTFLLTWIFGLALLIARFFISHTIAKRRSPSEQLILNQDIVWQETRVDQRRIARLLAWHRRKKALRRKDT